MDANGGLTRRRLLVGAAATVAAAGTTTGLVAAGVLPGRTRVREALGWNGPAGRIPDVAPGPSVDGTISSPSMPGPAAWRIAYPPGTSPGDALPIAVWLHGKGGDERSAFDELGLDRFLAAAVADGAAPFALASVAGGDGYWHERDDGTDSGRMVVEDLLPTLERRGLDMDRLALAGWSMGGYGALLLAERHGDDLGVEAVATMSAAIWEDPDDGVEAGAFDDQIQARAHDVLAVTEALSRTPMRVDCGADDPFADANRLLRERCSPTPAGGLDPGAHTVGYWRRVAPDHIGFLSRQLSS